MTFFRDRPDRLASFRRGDRSTLEELYREYLSHIQRLVRSGWRGADGSRGAALSRQDVVDIVQEVFARVFSERARLGFDGLRAFQPYLDTIARNLLVDWARRRGREIAAGSELDAGATAEPDEPPWADAATMTIVEDYLRTLPDELRQVHEERFVRGRSQRDAADALGISRQQLRTREARLRDGLRRLLDGKS
jgi:RNA polymerase sigma-70 factor (ECF subfamily)